MMEEGNQGSAGNGMSFTQAQRSAIEVTGNVLVAAAAGAGKTRTLVERCARLIVQGADVQDFLLVTFTEAAGAEMRSRLRAELEKLARTSGDERLHGQVALLDTAAIGTLHSFCLRLIREHFHALELDPQLVILDEQQTGPLVEAALDRAIDPLLRESSSLGKALRSWLNNLPGDAMVRMRTRVKRIHVYSRSLPFHARWLSSEAGRFARHEADGWVKQVFAELSRWAAVQGARLSAASGVPALRACADALSSLAEGPGTAGGWAVALAAIHDADKSLWPKGEKTRLRAPFKGFFEAAAFLKGIFGEDGKTFLNGIRQDWERARNEMLLLLEITDRFGKQFDLAKRELGGVDFSDQEQLCLRLLIDDSGGPSSVAQDCRSRFKHVLVDEAQDINAAQDAIIRAVSREGQEASRFVVGDMKQSIYRFRLADPSIFRAYEKAWGRPGGEGQVIVLRDNFRSCEGVLVPLNRLFRRIMRSDLGGVTYDDQSELCFGNPEGRHALAIGGGSSEPAVEVRILDQEAAVELPGDSAVSAPTLDREAVAVARRLKQLVMEHRPVWDDALKAFRPAAWSDMVILLRAPGARTEAYARAFHEEGVPLAASRGGFFDTQEVRDMLALVQVLDNPLQDIPLLAFLRSPFGLLSAEELALIRLCAKGQPFWNALRLAGERASAEEKLGGELQEKARGLVSRVMSWRRAVQVLSVSACLELALSESGYEIHMMTDARGSAQLANLRRFLDLARQFDPYQRQGLFRFQRFLEQQQESDTGLESAAPTGIDAVRLMSVHRSKGLEFSIVVAADLGRIFNTQDLSDDLLVNADGELCPRLSAPGRAGFYPPLVHWLASQHHKREMLGEEIRLLYVAATRARDLLILSGSDSMKGWVAGFEAGAHEDSDPAQARRVLEWIRPWVIEEAAASGLSTTSGRTSLIRWEVGPSAELDRMDVSSQGKDAGSGTQDWAGDVDVLRKLEWTYAQAGCTQESAKTSVTALRRRVAEAEGEESAQAPWLRRRPSHEGGPGRGHVSGRSAADRGVSHHRFLQHVDIARVDTLMDLRNEAERLRQAGQLSAEEIGELDFEAMQSFWGSEVGRQIRGRGEHVQREMPFTLRLGADQVRELIGGKGLPESAEEEFVVVQGQIDLVVECSEELWLVDYKTDRVGPGEAAARAEDYRAQLEIYARALEGIFGKPVTRRWVHFLHPGKTVLLASRSD